MSDEVGAMSVHGVASSAWHAHLVNEHCARMFTNHLTHLDGELMDVRLKQQPATWL